MRKSPVDHLKRRWARKIIIWHWFLNRRKQTKKPHYVRGGIDRAELCSHIGILLTITRLAEIIGKIVSALIHIIISGICGIWISFHIWMNTFLIFCRTFVRVGDWDRSLPSYTDVPVSKILAHNQFDARTQRNNIGLVKLQSKVEFNGTS